MNKIISIITIICLTVSGFMQQTYAGNKVEYSSIAYNMSGEEGKLAIRNENENISADAEELANLLGYSYQKNDDGTVGFYNRELKKLITATINSRDITVIVCARYSKLKYRTPYKIILENDKVWVPLKYFIYLMNSTFEIKNAILIIEEPQKNLLDDIFSMCLVNYQFNWSEFGYTEKDQNIILPTSAVVNFLNGLLDANDTSSWEEIGDVIFKWGKENAFDKKYCKNLVTLLCTLSSDELDELTEQSDRIYSLISSDGSFAELTDAVEKKQTNGLGDFEKLLNNIVNESENNELTRAYNSKKLSMAKAIKNRNKISNFKTTLNSIQDNVDLKKTSNFFKAISYLSEYIGFYYQASNCDEFRSKVVSDYCNEYEGEAISKETLNAMKSEVELLNADSTSYALVSMLENHSGDIALEVSEAITMNVANTSLSEIIGAEAMVVKLIWDLASDFIPFIRDGLSSADKFELAAYGTILQCELHKTASGEIDNLDLSSNNGDKDLYKLCKYLYLYLKCCQITRESAVASIESKKYAVGTEAIEILKTQAENKNKEIVAILAKLETITEKDNKAINEELEFGFLPSNSKSFKNDDSDLIKIIRNQSTSNIESTLIGTWVDRTDYDSDDYQEWWNGKTVFHEDGIITRGIWRYKESGTYVCSNDGKTITATLDEQYTDAPATDDVLGGWQETKDFKLQITYTYVDDNTMNVEYETFNRNLSDLTVQDSTIIYKQGSEVVSSDGTSSFSEMKEVYKKFLTEKVAETKYFKIVDIGTNQEPVLLIGEEGPEESQNNYWSCEVYYCEGGEIKQLENFGEGRSLGTVTQEGLNYVYSIGSDSCFFLQVENGKSKVIKYYNCRDLSADNCTFESGITLDGKVIESYGYLGDGEYNECLNDYDNSKVMEFEKNILTNRELIK